MAVSKEDLVVTPIGYIAFPYLTKPDTGRPNSSNKYGAALYIKKEDFKVMGQALLAKVLEVGRRLKGPNATLRDFKHTIKDCDALSPEEKAKLPEQVRSGYIRIGASSKHPPVVKDARQNLMSFDQINQISAGDFCRFVVAVYTYQQQGGGVALGLNVVQYKEKSGVTFGGAGAGVEMLSDLETTMEDPMTAMSVATGAPSAAAAAAPPKPADDLGLGL